jgi:hypothetical protein
MPRKSTAPRASRPLQGRKPAKTIPRPRSQALEVTQDSPPPAVTTKAFWPLMDRWSIPDDKALELLGHRRGPTRTGCRPRFTLDTDEVRRLDYLREIGVALELMFGDAGPWLKQPASALPFRGLTPLDYMIMRGTPGLAEGNRFLARWSLSQALRAEP